MQEMRGESRRNIFTRHKGKAQIVIPGMHLAHFTAYINRLRMSGSRIAVAVARDTITDCVYTYIPPTRDSSQS